MSDTVTIKRSEFDELVAHSQTLADITLGNNDRLGSIFLMQRELMERFGHTFPDGAATMSELYKDIGVLCTCITQEAAELRDWTPWKHWSKRLGNKTDVIPGSERHLHEITMEVVDLVHFIIELCIVCNLDPQDIYETYLEKNKINHERQDTGTY